MICDNDYCIYWKNNTCILTEITLDNLGICTSCIRISIPEKDIEHLRKNQLDEIESLMDDDF